MRKGIAAAACVMPLIGFYYFMLKPEAPPIAPTADHTPLVQVAAVEQGFIQHALPLNGVLRPEREVNLSAPLPGVFTTLSVREGEHVSLGQEIGRLVSPELASQIAQARAGVDTARARLAQAEKGLPLQAEAQETQIRQAEQNLMAAQARLAQAREAAVMTAEEADADLQRATAAMESARAQLAQVQHGARPEQVRQAEAQLAQARAGHVAAERGLKRAKFLYDRGGLPRAQLEAAEAAEAAARAQVDAAESQAALVKAGAAPEEIRMAEEQVRQAEAGLKSARAGEKRKQVSKHEMEAARSQVFQAEASLQAARAGRAQASVRQEEISAARAGLRQAMAMLQAAEAQLAAATLRSPVSGIVTRISAHLGESLMPGTPVATIVSLSGVYFEAVVSDRDRTLLKPGLSVSVRTAASAHSISGRIRDILPVAEADNRSFRVRVSLNAPGMRLTPGAFASGTAALSHKTRALLIPQTALQGKENSWYVLRVLGNRIQRRAVKVGASRAGKMELCSGLKETDRIVLNPLETLRDGERVRVAPGNEKE